MAKSWLNELVDEPEYNGRACRLASGIPIEVHDTFELRKNVNYLKHVRPPTAIEVGRMQWLEFRRFREGLSVGTTFVRTASVHGTTFLHD